MENQIPYMHCGGFCRKGSVRMSLEKRLEEREKFHRCQQHVCGEEQNNQTDHQGLGAPLSSAKEFKVLRRRTTLTIFLSILCLMCNVHTYCLPVQTLIATKYVPGLETAAGLGGGSQPHGGSSLRLQSPPCIPSSALMRAALRED